MALTVYLLAVVTVQLLTVWTTVRPESVGVTCEAADICKDAFAKQAADSVNYFDRYCELMETKIRCYRNVVSRCPADTRPYAESDLRRDTNEYSAKCEATVSPHVETERDTKNEKDVTVETYFFSHGSAPFVSRTSWIVLSLAVLAALSSRHV